MKRLILQTSRLVSLIIWMLVFINEVALAEDRIRVALVIGNNNYPNDMRLENPINDATAIRDKLARLGFQEENILYGVDVTEQKLKQLLVDFYARARTADVAMVFYAGHGIQVKGKNYMIPIDMDINIFQDPEKGIFDLSLRPDLNDFITAASEAKYVSMVVIDACRDNPFARNLARSIGRRRSSSTTGAGLATVSDADIPDYTLIAFATSAGSTALDGDAGGHSPFTEAILEHIDNGDNVRDMFDKVIEDVEKKTQKSQNPYKLERFKTRKFSFGTPQELPQPAITQEQLELWHKQGDDLLNGYLGKADAQAAIVFFTKAAEAGYVHSQIKLAKLYEKGIGTQKNKQKAISWYEKAAKQGNRLAKRKMNSLNP